MNGQDIFEKDKIIPVVTLNNSDLATDVANALLDGGINSIEVTFRTSAALDSIEKISRNCKNIFVGAGTVLTVDQAKKAIEKGAKFIVSPGTNPEVVKYCIDNDIIVVPGCATPSEIELALRLGIDVIKFFPAEALGGINTLKAVSAPYSNLRFLPTGGINENNLLCYLSFDKVVACGGSWIANSKLIEEKEFDVIRNNAEKTVKLINSNIN